MANPSFDGLRVLSLESRRAPEMEALIRRYGGEPFVAPSVRERPIEGNTEIFYWADRLFSRDFDMVVLMTGTGIAYLRDAIVTQHPKEKFVDALGSTALISRGPKPVVVLHELGLKARVVVQEPNTWREIVPVIEAQPERRVTILEYGKGNPEFVAALHSIGATVSPLSIYKWELPPDIEPLREAAYRIADGGCDVVIFTTSVQLVHLLQIAANLGIEPKVRESLMHRLVIASVGPIMNDALAEHSLEPDIVPAHPKMGILVRAAADQAASVLSNKRRCAR
jgi:uroporphyrinogen-III synthase